MKILVTYRQNNGPGKGWETGAALIRALRRMGHTAHPYGTTYQTGKQIAPDPAWTPDLIVFMECGDGERQYLELRENYPGVPLAMWDFDTAIHMDLTKKLVEMMKPDQLFLANPDMLPHFPGSKYLPYAADETRFKPTTGTKTGAAIIGSPFPERVAFAKSVGVEVIQTETGQEYADAVAGLKVHVHHTNSGGDGLLVMRYWETLCCGTVLLCPWDSAVDNTFEVDAMRSPAKIGHVVGYHGKEDASLKLLGLRNNPGWAQSIAANGRAHVLANHTYRHRAQEIFDAL
jgi:hypothetical protein